MKRFNITLLYNDDDDMKKFQIILIYNIILYTFIFGHLFKDTNITDNI